MTSSQSQTSADQKRDYSATVPASAASKTQTLKAQPLVQSKADSKVAAESEPEQTEALSEKSMSPNPARDGHQAADQSKGQSKIPEYLTRYPGWTVFASTFVKIFLAEIGDKTQITTLLMTAESHQPWVVFAGAATALILTSLLGVLLGQWLASRLSPRVLETAAGMALLGVAITLVWDLWQS